MDTSRHDSSSTNTGSILEEYGFRKTELRLQLLGMLAHEQFPLSAEAIRAKLPAADTVTLYRALEAFTEAGILERSELGHNHAHYELRVDRPHHHHAVCEGCGRVADIKVPHTERIHSTALAQAKQFKVINRHSLEFFGLCKTCA